MVTQVSPQGTPEMPPNTREVDLEAGLSNNQSLAVRASLFDTAERASDTTLISSPETTTTENGRSVLPKSPLVGLFKQQKGYGYRERIGNSNKYTSIAIEDSVLYTKVRAYIRDLSGMPTCVNANGYATKCTCLHLLQDFDDSTVDAVVKSLLNYSCLAPTARKAYQIDKVQYAGALADPNWNRKKGPETNYVLPVLISDEDVDADQISRLRDAFHHRVCISAWSNLHNIGFRRQVAMRRCADSMKIPVHKNTGNKNREKSMQEAKDSARNKLTWAAENLACPFATKIIRDIAGHVSHRNTANENEQEPIFLPPNTTRRGMWLEWVRGRGWDPVQTCKHRRIYKKKEEWTLSPGFYRTEEDAVNAEPTIISHRDGTTTTIQPTVAKNIIKYSTFFSLWAKEFPHLKVRERGEDTCTDCFKIKYRFRHLLNKRKCLEQKLADTDSAAATTVRMEENLEALLTRDCPETESTTVNDTNNDIGTTPEDLENLISEINAEIKIAEEHVKMHTIQRSEADMWIQEARADEEANKPLPDRTVTLTMDMSQNGQIPSLAGDQCGDFYYLSPMTQFIFGVCNNATRFMTTYIWGEGTAARGADNIVSCLYWYLVQNGIAGGTPVKRLVIIADNCPGQNKNFCVLHFCAWLVEAGWAREVVLHFLIKGHTKNECDSKFNSLKAGTRGINIFTEEGLDAAYTKDNKDSIDLKRVSGDKWKGWTAGLQTIYRKPTDQETLANHIFIFGAGSTKTSYTRQKYHGSDKIEFDLLPTSRMLIGGLVPNVRQKKVDELHLNLENLAPPGLSALKATDLHKKIGQEIVPQKFRYQYPAPSVEQQEKNEARKEKKNKEKKEKKVEKKKRQASHAGRPEEPTKQSPTKKVKKSTTNKANQKQQEEMV